MSTGVIGYQEPTSLRGTSGSQHEDAESGGELVSAVVLCWSQNQSDWDFELILPTRDIM